MYDQKTKKHFFHVYKWHFAIGTGALIAGGVAAFGIGIAGATVEAIRSGFISSPFHK